MSAVGQTRQPERAARHLAWRMAAWPARLIRPVLGLVLLCAGLVTVAMVALAWRLAQGPLDVTWLVRAAERVRADGAPPRIGVASASIAWGGFNDGVHSRLELRLHDLHAVGLTGGSASVAQADVTLAALPLLSARIVPRVVVLDGVQLRAVRSADGALRLDVDDDASNDGTGMPDVLAELRRPAGNGQTDPTLSALEHVVVEHAHVTVRDEASATSLEGDISDLDLRRRAGGGIDGSADGRFAWGETAVSVRLIAELRPDGGTHWQASLQPLATRPIDAGVLSRLDPALATFGSLDTVVQAQANLETSATLQPEHATLAISTGPGTLTVPGSAPVAFDRASAAASARWVGSAWLPAAVQLDPVVAVVVGSSGRRSTIRLTADAARADRSWTVRATLGFDQADFADLPSLWPVAWGGHTRPWLTENVTAGLAHDAAFTATLDVPAAEPAKAQVVQAGGTMQADNVVIHWLRPAPPIDHAQATLTVTGPDDLVITVPHAQQGPIPVTDGVLRFTGMSHKDQFLAMTASVQGKVPDLLKLLREKRLQLLDAHPLPITGSAGRVTGTLAVDVPMLDHLTFDQVSIASKGRLDGLRLNGFVAGRDLENGTITYDVTQDGLKAAGSATAAGIPGRLEVAMNFRAGDATEITQQAHFVGRVDAAALAAHGIDAAGMLTGGAAVVDTTYSEMRDGSARVAVAADLGPAALAVAGWHKPAGAPARAAATIQLMHGVITDVPQLTASGPELDVVTQAEMADGALRILRVRRLDLGPTRLSGEVIFPADPAGAMRIRASGPVLDLADQIEHLRSQGGANGATGGRPWVVDVRIGRVILGNGRALTDLAAHAEHADGRLQALQATTAGEAQLRASIAPVPNGRRLLVQAADAGALLRGLDLTRSIGGGRLAVDATFDDRLAEPPLEGRLQLGPFTVRDSVVLGKLLQAVTLYGIVDAVRGEGVYFAEATVPFCLCGNVLRLGPSRMSSASLGITAEGQVDLDRHTLLINGTVVPAYVLNTALGNLPLIGRLFSAERGGGLIAAGFSVSGPVASPAMSVNPLSLLTPGILRRLFD